MDRTLCRCLNVVEREVLAAIRDGARTVRAVGAACEAGTGCGSCHAAIRVLIEHEHMHESRRRKRPIRVQLSLFQDDGAP